MTYAYVDLYKRWSSDHDKKTGGFRKKMQSCKVPLTEMGSTLFFPSATDVALEKKYWPRNGLCTAERDRGIAEGSARAEQQILIYLHVSYR